MVALNELPTDVLKGSVQRHPQFRPKDPLWFAVLRRLGRALPGDARFRAALRVRVMRTLRWLLPNRGKPGLLPSDLAPPPADTGVPDYLVWSVIDWHYRLQRPQHLARELAKTGRRVFYLSCNFADDPDPGFRVEPLDSEGRLFQVFLHVRNAPPIYFEIASEGAYRQLVDGVKAFTTWAQTQDVVSLVEHAFWYRVARSLPRGHLVYDRMDFHQGFGTFSDDLALTERDLMSHADLTVVSSAWLDRDTARYTNRRLLLRNACEYKHFSVAPDTCFQDSKGRSVIGYFGAIADWIDLGLVAAIAERFTDCLVLLIGHDQCQASRRLSRHANVCVIGEIPYVDLPHYLHGFDVCILPFRLIPLTLATNPLKVYEYLSAGKPVVSVDLPEIGQFGDLVTLAGDESAFLRGISHGLVEPTNSEQPARRRAFAKRQTWAQRVAALISAVETESITGGEKQALSPHPRVNDNTV